MGRYRPVAPAARFPSGQPGMLDQTARFGQNRPFKDISLNYVFLLMTISDIASVRALEREVAQIYSVLDYAMHELPAGVLWNPHAAADSQCAELLVNLNRFEVL